MIFFNKKLPDRYPMIYQIELFAGCNLRCPLCHAGSRNIFRRKHKMTFEEYCKIFNQIEKYAEVIYLHMWGEPTLHDRLIDIINFSLNKNSSIILNVSTNGNNLSQQYAESLVRTGIQQIIFSIDGIDQASYEKYRRGGSFEDVMNFITWCLNAREKFNARTEFIAQCLQLKHTLPIIDKFREKMMFLGITPSFKPVFVGNYLNARKFLSEDVEIQRFKLSECKSIDNALAIQADGIVIPCCHHPEAGAGYNLGNMFEMSIEQVLLLPDRKRFNDDLHKSIAPTRYCVACTTPQLNNMAEEL
jgi:radical SAM protein with 4Fe4S-binding SPASM domain